MFFTSVQRKYLCSFFACGPCYDLLWLLVHKVTTYTIGILLYIIRAGMYLPFFTIFFICCFVCPCFLLLRGFFHFPKLVKTSKFFLSQAIVQSVSKSKSGCCNFGNYSVVVFSLMITQSKVALKGFTSQTLYFVLARHLHFY